jgi:hypothetical protein
MKTARSGRIVANSEVILALRVVFITVLVKRDYE